MRPIDETLSQTFRWVRFPLTLLVVMAHCKPIEDTSHWVCKFIDVLFSDVLTQTVVPTFFFISGFLFFHKFRSWDTMLFFDKIKRRLSTLLLPYLSWNLLPIALGGVGIAASSIVHFTNPLPQWQTLIEGTNWVHVFCGEISIQNLSLGYPANLPMWYVRDLMLMTLLSPIIYYFTARAGIWFVACCVLLSLIFDPGEVAFLNYYILGGYFAITKRDVVSQNRLMRYIVYVTAIAIVWLCVMSYYYPAIAGYRRQIIIIMCMVTPLAVIYSANYLSSIGCVKVWPLFYECSFFVYALHSFYMLHFANILLNSIPIYDSILFDIVKYLLQPVVTYFLCMIVYVGVKKVCPGLLKILMGSRIVA